MTEKQSERETEMEAEAEAVKGDQAEPEMETKAVKEG